MQRLLLKEAEAWANEEDELATNILKIEYQFYDQHLSQWLGNFCDKVIDAAEHPFYGRIARQSGWERRVNQDERQRPRGMIAAGSQNSKSDCVAKV